MSKRGVRGGHRVWRVRCKDGSEGVRVGKVSEG